MRYVKAIFGGIWSGHVLFYETIPASVWKPRTPQLRQAMASEFRPHLCRTVRYNETRRDETIMFLNYDHVIWLLGNTVPKFDQGPSQYLRGVTNLNEGRPLTPTPLPTSRRTALFLQHDVRGPTLTAWTEAKNSVLRTQHFTYASWHISHF